MRSRIVYVLLVALAPTECHAPSVSVDPCLPRPSGQPSALFRDEVAPAGELAVLVLDGRTQRPVERSVVALAGWGNPVFGDSHGRSRMTGLAPGRYELTVRGIAYLPARDSVVITSAAGHMLTFVMFMAPFACDTLTIASGSVSHRRPGTVNE